MVNRNPMTSVQWWRQVKTNADALLDWLADQYHGEITAHERIRQFADQYAPEGSPHRHVLGIIAEQELAHANWVGELLTTRGLAPQKLVKPERYWERTLRQIDSLESGAAVAAHAEAMRLERITVIANDSEAPADIRAVFRRILPQEKFHARAFAKMAGDTALMSAARSHADGMAAIGLIPAGF